MTRSAQHGTIRLKRHYKAAPARVFAAWAEPKARAQWDVPGRWVIAEQSFDFREGGRELKRFGPKHDPHFVADTLYLDIVPQQRIVFSYSMTSRGEPVSVSLTTIALSPDGNGSRLLLAEQVAFLDGYDDAGSREHGTRGLFDQLARFLEMQ